MINYTSSTQVSLLDFKHPFGVELDHQNRWVKLAETLPWDELVCIYAKRLSKHFGRKGIDARLAIAALIIKHKLGLSDDEVIQTLKENVYLQYFSGFKSFQTEKAFDSSLFVRLRKRMGKEEFDQMNLTIIQKVEPKSSLKLKKRNDDEPTIPPKDSPKKGKLKIDATVCDQMIDYPTDLKLLNASREESERLIDLLFKQTNRKTKPRTYRKEARKLYLSVVYKKRKKKSVIRKHIGKQIRYLKRNLHHIEILLNEINSVRFPLGYKDQKKYWVIQQVYAQQNEMYTDKKHIVANRIVNIHQPFIRPILRGKEKNKVEFGAKINVSIRDGFSRIDRLDWNNFNESTDLINQVENYKTCYGYYPELVLADNIYGTRANRKYLKEAGIRYSGKSLGRPKKIKETAYEKRKRLQELGERNHIEGKFGQGKNAYGLSKIRTRREDTSASWISCTFFVMNLVQFSKFIVFVKNLKHPMRSFLHQLILDSKFYKNNLV
jgi:IS5 family transposase